MPGRTIAPMKLLDLTLESPSANLALDEALLDEAESVASGAEWLRLWEPDQLMVVLGRASRVEEEVDLEACQVRDDDGLERDFPVDVFRRKCLLEGLDDIALTLQYEDRISAFEQARGG